MSVSRDEMETIICISHQDKTASVYSSHPATVRKLRGMVQSFPDEVKFEKENEQGIFVVIPSSFIKVSRKRKRTMSEEDKQKAAERMKNINQKKKGE